MSDFAQDPTDFDTALDDLLRDEALSEPATYSPPNGPSAVLRAIISGADQPGDLFQTDAITTRWRAMVRAADVPQPVAGAILAVAAPDGVDGDGTEHAGMLFTVRQFLLDAEGVSWTLGLDERAG